MIRTLSALLLSCVIGSTAAVAQSVKLMANTSPPYADQQLPQRGLGVELVEHVFAGSGIDATITIETWSRALEGAQLGVYDGLSSAWYADERAKDLLFSEPYLSSELIILKKRGDNRQYTSLEQLSGRIGVRTDYAYPVDLSANQNLVLVQENHLIQNLLNLVNGKVDYVIGDLRTVNQQLHEYLSGSRHQVSVTGVELPPVARHVAISRSLDGHAEIVAAFNKSLANAKRDGSHLAIVERWDERYQGQ
ncbi:hypothetical protein BST95_14285 [Halioglobus japonicus]|uniref:Solute-binding protein family 3/N-terminal domain-containing protein n=1 Tax=Halioglobus japonicus TaxID=930805 RepID=A0AAP8MH48_9GAMM|nr:MULTISPECIES: transporter substrate-binding domain-containing protein [Halioglobus]AQA19237.1 hypothetical protein BST95_14285 [Halioglobus japonicus]KZX59055.1 hypothetical protein A3709_16000 [Halioglobus sp. HI00S01]PLW87726.1 hypothetical protein C0029_03900 [Halioglobus japonicus]GHD06915.1 amino acid ABC transporter substrate-binding protein [Halioglobus japonicus]